MRYGMWFSWGSLLAIVILSLCSYLHFITPKTMGTSEALLLCCAWLGASLASHAGLTLRTVLLLTFALLVIIVVWMIHPVLFIYMPAIGVNLFLATVFFSSLRPGSDPLITRIARIEQPDFDDVVYGYTRMVTWAWGLFFSGLLLESILLIAFAPVEITLLFLNFLNYLLIPLFFTLEYLCRRVYLRHYTHMSPFTLAARLSRRGIMSVISYQKHH